MLDESLRDPSKDVFLLGAGFSIALSEASYRNGYPVFPSTDELGNEAVARVRESLEDQSRDELAERIWVTLADRLDAEQRVQVQDALRGQDLAARNLPRKKFKNGSFEVWLSSIAEDQPYLTQADNHANRELFYRIIEAVRTILLDRQGAVAGRYPGWYWEFLTALNARKSTVVTLNYDNLIEDGVDRHHLWDWDSTREVGTRDILADLPPTPPQYGVPWQPIANTFRLLKLHGSLSWYWAPGDASGSTLQRWETPEGFLYWWLPDFEDTRRSVLPGREPFIIPPATTKSPYYANPITREIWTRARDALASANRIIVIGTSVPPGDVTLANMIDQSVVQFPPLVDWIVVDRNADQVRERLESIVGSITRESWLASSSLKPKYCGKDSVEEFIHEFVDQQACNVLRQVRESVESFPDAEVVVCWGGMTSVGAIRSIEQFEGPDSDGNAIVRLKQDMHTGPDGSVATVNEHPLRALAPYLEKSKRIVALTPSGNRYPILDVRHPTPADEHHRVGPMFLVFGGHPPVMEMTPTSLYG